MSTSACVSSSPTITKNSRHGKTLNCSPHSIKIKQSINISKPDLVKDVSVPNGINYNGPGNYSFTVQFYKEEFNKTIPIYIYSEIIDNKSMRITRTITGVNLTE